MKLLTGTTRPRLPREPETIPHFHPEPAPKSGSFHGFLTGLAAGIAAALIAVYHPGIGWNLLPDPRPEPVGAKALEPKSVPASALDRYEDLKRQVEEANERVLVADQRVVELQKQLAEARIKADHAQGILDGVLAGIEREAIARSQTTGTPSLRELAQRLDPGVVAWLLTTNDRLTLCSKTH